MMMMMMISFTLTPHLNGDTLNTVFPEIGVTPALFHCSPNPKCQDTLDLIEQEIKIAIFRYWKTRASHASALKRKSGELLR
jgi:hypothetical protein